MDVEASGPRRRDPSLEIELDAFRTTGEIVAELPPLMRFAGYEILGRIAVGGMAEVFLAREHGEAGSTRQIALKIIQPRLAANPDFAELFMREGKVALGIRHPNVCHVYRFGMEQGHPFLAMELVQGITLRDLHTRVRRLGASIPIAITTKVIAIVAEALHSAHVARDERGQALGIVHQDVSPHNVMIAYDGTVKLLDFGVASTSSERANAESQSTIRGKAGYLSPEQCTGAPLDARSDVFALGIVLYEMLTGARLFARSKSVDSIRAIACEPLSPWPASIPAPLTRVLDRALARDPADRYPSAAAMQEELERTLAESRMAMTSAKIAEELARVLGEDFGRAPNVETSSEAVAWLRSSNKEALAVDTNTRPMMRPILMGGLGIIVLALTALVLFNVITSPDSTPSGEIVAEEILDTPGEVTAPSAVEPPVTAMPAMPVEIPAPRADEAPLQEPREQEEARPSPGRFRAPARRWSPPTSATPEPSASSGRAPSTDFIDDPGF